MTLILRFKIILSVLSPFLIFQGCYSLSSSTTLQYNNKPIHPLVVKDLLPDISNNAPKTCVKITSQTKEQVETINETSIENKGIWYRSYYGQQGFVDYHHVGKYGELYCLIVRNYDGTLGEAYVCFISLKRNKICMEGYKKAENLKDDFVRMSDGDLYIGNFRYSINRILNPNQK